MRALVLSGGGLFGAWQAGAWAALAGRFQPDLIVGASVGALNGYAIACGVSPEKLRELWLTERRTAFSELPEHILGLMEHRPQIDFALVVTDLLRLKPRIIRGREVTWSHLAASCAVPFFFRRSALTGDCIRTGVC